MKSQKGFSLIQVMVSLSVGLIVILGMLAVYIITIKGNTDTYNSAQLNQELGVAMTIMTNDIRRAGYWGEAILRSDSHDNIFNGLQIHDFAGQTDACVLYNYDADSDGVVDINEYYGFRWNNGTIEIKSQGSTLADCTNDVSAEWSNMLDSSILSITKLAFNLDFSQCKNFTTNEAALCSALTAPTAGDDILEVRYVGIEVDGEVVASSDIRVSINRSVKVKNNRIYIQP